MSKTGVGAYAYLIPRVRGMISTLLPQAIFAKLNACSDLASLFSILADTPYGKHLESGPEKPMNSRSASYDIRKVLTQAYQVVLKAAPPTAIPLLSQLFRLYEVDNLKAVLRGIAIGEEWEAIRYVLFPTGVLSNLPFESMIEKGTVDGAIECLKNSEYRRVLQLALDRYHEENSLFPLEVALDLFYWNTLWTKIEYLPSDDRAVARKLIGLIVDKNNLTWAARYRIYHQFSESEIINYTLPFGYKVDDAGIRAVASGNNLPDSIARTYPKLAEALSVSKMEKNALPLAEVEMQQKFLETCRSVFPSGKFDIGLPLAYLFVLEIEIQDLTLLIEAKALNISVESYSPFLINRVVVPSTYSSGI